MSPWLPWLPWVGIAIGLAIPLVAIALLPWGVRTWIETGGKMKDPLKWRLPTYPLSLRVITPGDLFGLTGEGTDPDYRNTVELVQWSVNGWTIWDVDGNDRLPSDLRYVKPS